MSNAVQKIDEQAPAVQSETSALISMIERAARDPAVDIDKMERLFQMHERIEARRAVQAYNAAMSAAQAELPAVVKNKKNEHTNARYADLYAIADECLPIIHGHGFGLSFSECEATEPNCIGVSCRASHSAGHAETYKFNVPLDSTGSQGKVNKTATQAYGSTFTYGRRYATCGVFNIIITDRDGNRVTQAEPAETRGAALADLRQLIANPAAKTSEAKICEAYSVEVLDDLGIKQINQARSALSQRVRK